MRFLWLLWWMACLAAAARAGKTAYITNQLSDTVSVVDLDSIEVWTTIEVGGRPALLCRLKVAVSARQVPKASICR